MASTLKQRLRRFNGTDYDTIYLSPNVEDAIGTLPVENGGTGQTTLELVRNAMGLGNTTGALPVANGGTGRTTLTSGYFLRGNGTSAITMDSVATVKSALGIGSSAHVAVASMTRASGSTNTIYTANNLGFVVKGLFGTYVSVNNGYDTEVTVQYPVKCLEGSGSATDNCIVGSYQRMTKSGSAWVFEVYWHGKLSIQTNTTSSFQIRISAGTTADSYMSYALLNTLIFFG